MGKWLYASFGEYIHVFPLGINQTVELVGHRVCICSFIVGNGKLFAK